MTLPRSITSIISQDFDMNKKLQSLALLMVVTLGLLIPAFGQEEVIINDQGDVLNLKPVKFKSGMLFVDDVEVLGGGGTGTGGNPELINVANGFVQLDSSTRYPALNGSLITNLTKNQVGLPNVDNTSDLNKPISTAVQSALDAKASAAALSAHISNTSNPHSVTKAQVGLPLAENTADLDKPISTATQTALDAKQSLSAKGAANGYAGLGSDGKVPTGQLPAASSGTVQQFNFTNGGGFTGSVSTATTTPTLSLVLNANSVSLSQMANMSTAKLLGRITAGSGPPEELSQAQGQSLLGLIIGPAVGATVQPYNASTTTLGNSTTGTGTVIVKQTAPTISGGILTGNTTTSGGGTFNGLTLTAGTGTLTLGSNIETFGASFTFNGTGGTVDLGAGGTVAYSTVQDIGNPGTGSAVINGTTDLVRFTQVLTQPLALTLPAASGRKTIRFIDPVGVASSTNTISVTSAGTDTINGAAAGSLVTIANGNFLVNQLASNGVSKWAIQQIPITAIQDYANSTLALTSPGPGIDAFMVLDSTIPGIRVYPSSALQLSGGTVILAPTGVTPSTYSNPTMQVGADGRIVTISSGSTGSTPDIYDLDASTTQTVTTGKTGAQTTLPFTAATAATLPPASAFPKGGVFTFSDKIGTVNGTTHVLTINPASGSGDTFNGAGTFTITSPYAIREFVSDHINSWTVMAVTQQGNTFNGNTQLVQTDSNGNLPKIPGVLFTAKTLTGVSLTTVASNTGTFTTARQFAYCGCIIVTTSITTPSTTTLPAVQIKTGTGVTLASPTYVNGLVQASSVFSSYTPAATNIAVPASNTIGLNVQTASTSATWLVDVYIVGMYTN